MPARSTDEDENDEAVWFRHSASLRIFGRIPDLDALSKELGVTPTHTHRKGERRSPRAEAYEHDMWSFCVPVSPAEPLDEHIRVLWKTFKPERFVLLELKKTLTVDVFCTYSTNAACAGIEVSPESFEMFQVLQIPFGLSIL